MYDQVWLTDTQCRKSSILLTYTKTICVHCNLTVKPLHTSAFGTKAFVATSEVSLIQRDNEWYADEVDALISSMSLIQECPLRDSQTKVAHTERCQMLKCQVTAIKKACNIIISCTTSY